MAVLPAVTLFCRDSVQNHNARGVTHPSATEAGRGVALTVFFGGAGGT
jgi:hypothetical protein